MNLIMKQKNGQEYACMAADWIKNTRESTPIIKVPLQFTFPPVEALSKQLTKLNSSHQYRICYLGPHWQNSVMFHKKYSGLGGYKFDEKKVNKNSSFFQDSMNHNQYYKNQIYYRAFEGMNPTLKLQEELLFESRFESGNLDCVVKVAANEYDLFLRIDSNTRGNIFWFYFSVRNCQSRRVKINICNLTKSDTHFSKGLNPFVYSSQSREWSQNGLLNVTFQQKRLRYNFLYEKMEMNPFYELSFEVEFKGQEEMRFAYCIPYTYSDLLVDLEKIKQVAKVDTLGQTLTGVNIPVVSIGKQDKQGRKPFLLITGRVHPGETNGSLILSNLMKQLCFSPQFRYLRDKLITIIVPMLNPDGVILGNSRTSAAGKDLNREFKSKNQTLFPQIVALKSLVSKISETHMIDMYLDFHGHSRKKNMFMFGPNYSISQSLYYKCRVLPKILSTLTPTFRYYGCNYEIPPDKRATARAVMLNQMMIPLVYTIQTSLGFYFDPVVHKTIAFDRTQWEVIGNYVLVALKEYYEDLEQLQEYLQSKRKARKEDLKDINGVHSNLPSRLKVIKESRRQQKQIKLFKLYESIKQEQEKRAKLGKKEEQSDSDSDSHNSKEELEREKMYEFTEMVALHIQEQKHEQTVSLINNETEKTKKSMKGSKINMIKRRKQWQKGEECLLEEFQSQMKVKEKRENMRSQVLTRRKKIEKGLEAQRDQAVSQDLKCDYQDRQRLVHSLSKNKDDSNLQTESQPNFISVQKKLNKLSVRMFNFNKVIAEQNASLSQNIKRRYYKSVRLQKEYINFQQNGGSPHAVKFPPPEEPSNSPSRHIQEDDAAEKEEVVAIYSTSDLKSREKYRFPSSYYKIRYQNIKSKGNEQRKRKEEKPSIELKSMFQINKNSRKLNSFTVDAVESGKSKETPKIQEKVEMDRGVFAKINQFPLL